MKERKLKKTTLTEGQDVNQEVTRLRSIGDLRNATVREFNEGILRATVGSSRVTLGCITFGESRRLNGVAVSNAKNDGAGGTVKNVSLTIDEEE